MSTLGAAIRDVLISSTPVYALVGEKISPLKVAQTDNYPAIVYQRISETLLGCKGDNESRVVRMQFNIFSKTYEEADLVKQALTGTLDGFMGTRKGWHITITDMENARDLYAEDAKIYGIGVDYMITVSPQQKLEN